MRFRDLPRDRQSESDTARPGGEKRFKDSIAESRRNAGSGIFDHQFDSRIFRATFDLDFTTYRRRLRGIGQKASEHLCNQAPEKPVSRRHRPRFRRVFLP